MPEETSSNTQDSVILAKAVENVFRKLIRLLVGRISLTKLQEMISFIYVQETEKKLKIDLAGKNIPMTQIALITGLDSRTIVNIRKKIEEKGELYQQQFLQELTPESAIVEAWIKLVNAAPKGKKQEYKCLSYGEKDSAFEELFKKTISARGVTAQSIIQRLVDTKSVTCNKKSKIVKLIVKKFSPYLSDDELQVFNAAFLSIASLISTAEVNISNLSGERFFQRQVWTFSLPSNKRQPFRAAMKSHLESVEKASIQKIEPWEAHGGNSKLISAGLGFYYFEDL